MKSVFTFAALVVALVSSVANAASLTSVKTEPSAYAIYLNGAPENGAFDTVIFNATPDVGQSFTNQNAGTSAGAPRPAGQAFTYRNRALDFATDDPDFPGLGWTIVGAQSNATGLQFSGGPTGFKISTAGQPNGALFLANINMPNGVGVANVKLVNNGQQVADLTIPINPIPEPASFALAGLSMLGFAAIRRRLA